MSLALLLAACLASASSVWQFAPHPSKGVSNRDAPIVTIDMDLPADKRWLPVVTEWQRKGMMDELKKYFDSLFAEKHAAALEKYGERRSARTHTLCCEVLHKRTPARAQTPCTAWDLASLLEHGFNQEHAAELRSVAKVEAPARLEQEETRVRTVLFLPASAVHGRPPSTRWARL